MMSSVISPNKEIRQIVRELERAGFIVTKKTSKHIKIVNPLTNQQISIPSTPAGNGRQRQNMLMSLRSIGFDDTAFKGVTKKKEKINE